LGVEDYVDVRNVGQHPGPSNLPEGRRLFKFLEPFSRYSRGKHWVDDHNNRRHDPIGLEEVWHTKWWPMRQFTFICSVAEVNAVQSRAQGTPDLTLPQLQFRRKLAQQMLENTIGVVQVVPEVPEVAPRRTRRQSNEQHQCLRRGINDGTWNPYTRRFNRVETDYVRHRCSKCGAKMARHYCSCDPSTPLCIGCHAIHANSLN
jgi:hypothetical protein